MSLVLTLKRHESVSLFALEGLITVKVDTDEQGRIVLIVNAPKSIRVVRGELTEKGVAK